MIHNEIWNSNQLQNRGKTNSSSNIDINNNKEPDYISMGIEHLESGKLMSLIRIDFINQSF